MKQNYTKTHSSQKAANNHARKIRKRGGNVTGKKVKAGFKIEYTFPSGSFDVTATNLSELLQQSAYLDTKTVEVTFVPYGTNKKGKKSYFDVIDEYRDIFDLMKSKDVVSVKFISNARTTKRK